MKKTMFLVMCFLLCLTLNSYAEFRGGFFDNQPIVTEDLTATTATIDSLSVNGDTSRVTLSDSSYLGVDSDILTLSSTANLDIKSSNIIYVGIDDDIETAVTNATAGDTLILASGTYTITSAIDIAKAINIIGQGIDRTIIQSTAHDDMIIAQASNVTISNMSLNLTRASSATSKSCIYFRGLSATVLTGCNVKNVNTNIISASSGANTGIKYYDASGTVEDVIIRGNCTEGYNYGIFMINGSTAETTTIVNVYNADILLDNTVTGTGIEGVRSEDSSATNDNTINIYNSHIIANDTSTATSCKGFSCSGGDAYINATNTYVKGADSDVTNSGTTTLKSVTLGSGVTSGTIIYDGSHGSISSANIKSTTQGINILPYFDLDIDDTEEYNVSIAGGKAGWGYVRLGAEWARFSFTAAAVVTLIDNSANVGTTDGTDSKLNIYDSGTVVVIENQLGDNQILELELHYID